MIRRICSVYFLLFILISTFSDAQTPSWIWARQNSGAGQIRDTRIAVDDSDNLIVSGTFWNGTIVFGNDTASGTYYDSFIAKYDPSGNVLWGRGVHGDGVESILKICTDNSGNIYAAGNFNDSVLTVDSIDIESRGGYNGFVIKYSPTGNVIWAKSIKGSSRYSLVNTYTIYSDGDNIFIGGTCYAELIDFGNLTVPADSNQSYGYVAKLDTSGECVWAKTFHGTYGGGSTVRTMGITTDPSGNVIVIGDVYDPCFIFANDTLFNNIQRQNVVTLKYDAAGNEVWGKNFSGTGSYHNKSFGVTTDDFSNIYFIGSFQCDTLFLDSSEYLVNKGTLNSYITKMNSSGDLQWKFQIGGSSVDQIFGVDWSPSGKIGISGSFNSDSIMFGNTLLQNFTQPPVNDLYVAELDPLTGDVNWVIQAGGTSDDNGYDNVYDSNDNFNVVGISQSDPGVFGPDTLHCVSSYNVILAKLDLNSKANPDINYDEVQIFPNPVSSLLNITTKQAVSEISITDVLGNIMYHKKFDNVKNPSVDVSEFKTGLYFVRLVTSAGNCNRRFIKL